MPSWTKRFVPLGMGPRDTPSSDCPRSARSCIRVQQRLGPVEIGDRLAMATTTVHAILVRCRLNRDGSVSGALRPGRIEAGRRHRRGHSRAVGPSGSSCDLRGRRGGGSLVSQTSPPTSLCATCRCPPADAQYRRASVTAASYTRPSRPQPSASASARKHGRADSSRSPGRVRCAEECSICRPIGLDCPPFTLRRRAASIPCFSRYSGHGQQGKPLILQGKP